MKQNLKERQDHLLLSPIHCTYQISGSNSKLWLESEPLKILVGINSEQYFGGRSQAHVWYLGTNFVSNLTRACLTPEKWVGSILIHFFTGIRRYSIVKTIFALECPNLCKKRNWGPIFFLIREFRKTAFSPRSQSGTNLERKLSKIRSGCCHSIHPGPQSTAGVELGLG